MSDSPSPIPHPALSKKSESRVAAVEALYAQRLSEKTKTAASAINDIIEYYQETNDHKKIQPHFITTLVEGTLTHQANIDQLITSHLADNWRFDRLNIILQCILQIGTFELAHHPETPFKVIINEYTQITHYFCDEKETAFVNGILETIADFLRSNP